MSNFRQGYYTPKNPTKYVGDITKIVYRSSWELKFNQFLDNNPNILKWGSEPFPIPYIKVTDNKIHNYFPDYYIMIQQKSGAVVEELIEVKPASQTRPSRSRNQKNKLYEDIQYAINTSKWQSAVKWCEDVYKRTGRKITFRIVTEKELFV